MKQDNNWLIYNLSTDKEFTFDDVINYWLTLFPEIKKKEELEKLLQEISNTNFEKLGNIITVPKNMVKNF